MTSNDQELKTPEQYFQNGRAWLVEAEDNLVEGQDSATLAMLASRRDEIVDAFGASGLTVRLSIVPGTEEDVSMQTAAFDVSLLREHHLIDVRG